ncbi:hypothetical protein DPEC_G00171870 [Dallia pectoralis]|uniref:Uncharacterized protein n=1 Tax=Dallia pectoralis TaxID=75939 RepID=A0ACC2GDU1_DALPE|nr:hypothetical protein DPEC_G00171870 [Dallia pectoralis]
MSSLPRQLRDESDFDQLPQYIPVSAAIADIEEKKGFIDYYRFVIEVKTKGGSKYLIYRRYSLFFNLHHELEVKYSPEYQETPGLNICTLPHLPGKVFIGNKKEIAENRIPELNTYMKRLLGLPTRVLLDPLIQMFFYQTEADSQHLPKALRRLRPPTRRVKTVKPTQTDMFSSPRAEAVFDFSGSGRLELSFKAEDVIFLLRRVNADWLEGAVKDRIGIFPESFVKIIKPLPEDNDEGGEDSRKGAGSYSCLRCYLLSPEGVDTRDVCVEEDISTQPSYKELVSRMRDVFKLDGVIALNYRDPDGDLVRILDNEDVLVMVAEGRRHRAKLKRPVNQFPWELYITKASDLSVYNTET